MEMGEGRGHRFFSNRTVSLPMLSRRPAEKVSGYCILRGKVVADRYCY